MSSLPPRLELARLPTPVQRLTALSDGLGLDLHLKRDDLTGSVLSGGDVRKLEYALAPAVGEGADVLLTSGPLSGDYCRAAAAAARRLGLDVELFVPAGDVEGAAGGNARIARLMAPELHPVAGGDAGVPMRARAEDLAARGRQPHVLPEGAATPTGCLGFVRCMEEIVVHEAEAGAAFDAVVTATDSGAALCGLLAGAELHGFHGRVVGVPVGRRARTVAGRVRRLLDALRAELLPDLGAELDDAALLDPRDGPVSEREAVRRRDVAVLTGVVLDPASCGRALEAARLLVRDGALPASARILVLASRGVFASA